MNENAIFRHLSAGFRLREYADGPPFSTLLYFVQLLVDQHRHE